MQPLATTIRTIASAARIIGSGSDDDAAGGHRRRRPAPLRIVSRVTLQHSVARARELVRAAGLRWFPQILKTKQGTFDYEGADVTRVQQLVGEADAIARLDVAILHRLLRRRFGDKFSSCYLDRLQRATSADLDLWADRVLTAASLDAVFAPAGD